jgi:multicomponent Na+:H+ antiporter subunit D
MRAHHEENQTRFFVCFAAAIGATMGIAFAGNLLTLFVFYEVLTLSTYPLVTHAGTDDARKAGRLYLGILLTTSIGFLFMAVILTWHFAGTLDFRRGGILASSSGAKAMLPVLVGLFAFGIGKAALMPFHRWLPAAMVAPTPVSALLHAVAVVKAGVFSVLKVVVYIFGTDFLRASGASVWLTWVAGATVLLASLIALTKDNLKARLAYSTVSQLSYIVLGAALATKMGVLGGAMHIAMHAFGKITLFFCAGAIMVASHKTEVSQMQGLGRRMPFTFAAFVLGAVSIIGLPPMGGAWSKFELMLAAADTGQMVFVAVLMISSLLNIAYLIPVAIRGFLPPRLEAGGNPGSGHEPDGGGIKEAPAFCVVPLCLTALGCVVLFFYADRLYSFLRPIAGG